MADRPRSAATDAQGSEARRGEILRRLAVEGQVQVPELAERLGVVEMTIRRDLAVLERAGRLRRVHGGAAPARPQPHEARADEMAAEKERIAATLAPRLAKRSAVGIDLGSTCRAVAARLAARDDLFVVTASIHVALEFRHSASHLLLLGGLLTPDLSLTASAPDPVLADVRLDTLVLGCGGVDPVAGVTYFDLAEVQTRRALRAVADRVVLAADHTKLGRHRAINFGGLELLDELVTDRPVDATFAHACTAAGVKVVVAG